MTEQYPTGTVRGDRPAEVVDPDGYTWEWTDADKRGVPGYQIRGLAGPEAMGPAHTYGYVLYARYCVHGPDCHHRVADPGEDVVP